jgi:hypothetical protein
MATTTTERGSCCSYYVLECAASVKIVRLVSQPSKHLDNSTVFLSLRGGQADLVPSAREGTRAPEWRGHRDRLDPARGDHCRETTARSSLVTEPWEEHRCLARQPSEQPKQSCSSRETEHRSMSFATELVICDMYVCAVRTPWCEPTTTRNPPKSKLRFAFWSVQHAARTCNDERITYSHVFRHLSILFPFPLPHVPPCIISPALAPLATKAGFAH